MVSSHGCFVWYELTTTDPDAAKTFYTDVVGWSTRDASMPGAAYTLFAAGEDPVAGLTGLPAEARKMGAQPRWMGYVGVDDVDVATDRLQRLGGTVYVPPTDVPDVSRFSIVADPQAATLALVKGLNSGQQQPAALGMLGHVGWHELSAVDWEKAFAFYGELFGWQKVDADFGGIGTYLLFSAGGQTVGGMSTKPPTVPMPFWLYYFNVGDLDAAAERVKAGGGKILEGPLEARGGNRIVRCTDPQGAMFALRTGRPKTIGYFGPAAADDPASTRLFVPKRAGPNA
ncbi:MAG TPA: VOC family protein [Xanthobacteraceae bacterium]|nr:VOC family protein [Xanthobacteraceae bacterium]